MLIVVAIAAVVIIYFAVRAMRYVEDVQQLSNAQEWAKHKLYHGEPLSLICGPAPYLVLGANEEVLGVIPDTTLMEPRAVRVSRGRYNGLSFRVARGLTLHAGGYGSVGESHDEYRPIDQGTLAFTNQRLTFVGAARTSSIDLEKLVSVDAYTDGLGIHRAGKEKAQIFVFSKNIKLPFDYNGETKFSSVDGRIVRSAILQALELRRHPELLGKSVDELKAIEQQKEKK